MQASRDWPRTLAPAAYKGFPFFVDEESLPKSGREVATHQYVKAEAHDTEDMGRKPREIRVDAYLASDTADADARAFVELCSQPGPGLLVLPQLGTYQARCHNCHVAGKKDELGRIKLVLDFCEAGNAGTTISATPLGNRQAASTLGAMPVTASGSISAHDPGAVVNAGAVLHDYESPSRF